MAVTSSSLGYRRAQADNARTQAAYVAYYANGSNGTGASVTFPENVQGFSVANTSTQWVRVTVQFDASVSTAVPAASRVIVLPPESTYQVDYGQNDDNAVGFVEPVTGVDVEVVSVSTLGSGALTDAGALPVVASVPTNVYVAINVASA